MSSARQPPKPELAEEVQPPEALALVVAQLGAEPAARRARRELADAVEPFAQRA